MLLELRYTIGDIGGEYVKRVQAYPIGSDDANLILYPVNIRNKWIVDRYDLTTDNRACIHVIEVRVRIIDLHR